MIVILLGLLVTWLFISSVFYDSGFKSRYGYSDLDEDRTKTNLNAIALTLNVYEYIIGVNWKDIFYPKTGIDKEIAEEENEIAELERQKEKIDTLANLKRRKERLFKEVHEDYEGTSNEYWICPQCRRTFKDLETLNNHSEMEHPF